MQPSLIVHADWGSNPKKRWLARADLGAEGRYTAHAPELVGPADTLVSRLHTAAGQSGSLLLGFDFPIGLPLAYATRAGIDDFLTLLPRLGHDEWADFYDVAAHPAEINLHRPFYPKRPGGSRQQHLLAGLGVESMNDLRRRCDLVQFHRRAACPIFWTLGGQQVGKAAILGWQQVLVPALHRTDPTTVIWPFSGDLFDLIGPGRVVIAETYPGECYHHLGVTFSARRAGRKSGKRVQADRRANSEVLLGWTEQAGVAVAPALRQQIVDGFGPAPDGEDPFDAVIGLLGMLNVVLQYRAPGPPLDERAGRIEGWILGQT